MRNTRPTEKETAAIIAAETSQEPPSSSDTNLKTHQNLDDNDDVQNSGDHATETQIISDPGTNWLRDAQRATMAGIREFVLPLNNPDVVTVSKADHMFPDDIVVGLVIDGHARAYPWWILENYHVVNDTLPSRDPGYVALCEKCSGAAAFHPTIDQLPQRPLIFQISGVGMGTFEITDVQTLSTWHPFTGRAIESPLTDTKLTRIPVVLERWSQCQKNHPDGDIVYASYQMRIRDHGRVGGTVGHPNRIKVVDRPTSLNLVDNRLPTNEMVYGLLAADHERGITANRSSAVSLSRDGCGHFFCAVNTVPLVSNGNLKTRC